jgi:hypothetical protein
VKLEAALPVGMDWLGGSSLDNDGTSWHCQTGRVRLAKREGVTRVNQRQEAPKDDPPALTWRIWAGLRRAPTSWGTPWPVDVAGREAARKYCGVRAAMPRGHSWAPNSLNGFAVNMGTIPVAPRLLGKVRRRPTLPEWGGGPVVVRGRESRPHGEGVQQSRGDTASKGGRW